MKLKPSSGWNNRTKILHFVLLGMCVAASVSLRPLVVMAQEPNPQDLVQAWLDKAEQYSEKKLAPAISGDNYILFSVLNYDGAYVFSTLSKLLAERNPLLSQKLFARATYMMDPVLKNYSRMSNIENPSGAPGYYTYNIGARVMASDPRTDPVKLSLFRLITTNYARGGSYANPFHVFRYDDNPEYDQWPVHRVPDGELVRPNLIRPYSLGALSHLVSDDWYEEFESREYYRLAHKEYINRFLKNYVFGPKGIQLAFRDIANRLEAVDDDITQVPEAWESPTNYEFTPFMWAHLMRALIYIYEDPLYNDYNDQILALGEELADYSIRFFWQESGENKGFIYRIGEGGVITDKPAADLSLFEMPWFAWLYSKTKDPKYHQVCLELTNSGNRFGYWSGLKQMNQLTLWAYHGFQWLGWVDEPFRVFWRDEVDPTTISGVWNGFQEQTNVIECSSGYSKPILTSLLLVDSQGETVGERSVELAGHGTSHSVLNEYDISNKYGTYFVTIQGMEEVASLVRCRTLFYRNAQASDKRQLEYAYAIPTGALLSGSSSGLYNSMNPEGPLGLAVLNWLSVFNPGEEPFSATVEIYNQDGSLNTERSYRIENLLQGDRWDSAVGHPDGQTTGRYRIVPDNPEQLYGAFLSRYGRLDAQTFNFTFTLLAKKGVNDSGLVPASTMGPALNWAEIANDSENEAEVQIEVFSHEGTTLFDETRNIAAGAQYHLYLNEHLGELAVGYFRVQVLGGGNVEGTLLVQSLFYGHSSAEPGRVAWSYASQASGPAAADARGLPIPINTFYQSANWLKIFNPTNQETEVSVFLHALNGEDISNRFSTLSLTGSTDLALHEEVGHDFAGLLRVKSETSIQAEVLRVFPMKSGDMNEIGYITNVMP